jgi:hypothetical protein
VLLWNGLGDTDPRYTISCLETHVNPLKPEEEKLEVMNTLKKKRKLRENNE